MVASSVGFSVQFRRVQTARNWPDDGSGTDCGEAVAQPIAAVLMPKALPKAGNRTTMICGAAAMTVSLGAAAFALWTQASVPILMSIWLCSGLGYSAVLTPVGRLLATCSTGDDRPSLFSAQFALSHACWLITYPLAGWGGAMLGQAGIAIVLAAVSAAATATCIRLWPVDAGPPARSIANP